MGPGEAGVMVSADEVVTLLETAAARLRDRGWGRGDYGPPGGPNCILGAVAYEAKVDPHDYQARIAGNSPLKGAIDALAYVLGTSGVAIWNDTVCPNAAAAVDLLLETAKDVAGTGEAP